MAQFLSSVESGQRNLRVVLFIIILATLPFYCIGFVLWGAAPVTPGSVFSTATATLPPVTQSPTMTFTPSPSPGFGPLATVTSFSPLQPTPRQFLPPRTVPLPTFTPIPVIIPTATPAPTLTTIPQATAPPAPTSTTIPLATATPVPQATVTPAPTLTPVPQATDPPSLDATATTVPIFPTDTPVPAEETTGDGDNGVPPDSGGTGSDTSNAVDAPVVVDLVPDDAVPTPTPETADGSA